MNKTAIKNFAVWARRKLISEITYKAGLLGVTEKGAAEPLPQSTKDLQFFDIGTKTYAEVQGAEIAQRNALVAAIRDKAREVDYKTAFQNVVEEVAYTWFNRMIAIRFMEINDYLPSRVRVLSSENPGKLEPDFVTNPFDTDLDFTPYERDRVLQFKDENKLDELFRALFIKQCNKLHEILPELFEATRDYTELLLTISFTDKDGVVYHLTHDIPESDFDISHTDEDGKTPGQVEIIGWMYQYYNTELNDLVYDGSMSKSRIPKELLPAATTIYTPDWAIKYMVENSLGRLWVEGHPNDALKAGWKYYLEEAEQEPDVQAQLVKLREDYAKLNPEDIEVIDPCMGSGHILVYAFDVLMQIYEAQGYTQRDAACLIVEKNLYGLDINPRAYQLAYFAVMMKARQYNRRILNGEIRPHLYAIQDSHGINRNQLQFFGWSMGDVERNKALTQVEYLLDTFRDAKEYGSILSVDMLDWDLLYRFAGTVDYSDQISMDELNLEATKDALWMLIEQGAVLTQKYDVVVTNPPYLGSSRFSTKLNDFVIANYPDVKADLSMVMFKHALRDMCQKNGFVSFITTTSWMFLSSFEKLRSFVLTGYDFESLVDFGTELFEGKVGHNPIVAWVNRKTHTDYAMTGIRLVDYCYSRRDEKEPEFFNKRNYHYPKQSNFSKIPGSPVAYWVGNATLQAFNNHTIGEISEPRMGLTTGNNDYYLRLWFEVFIGAIGFRFSRELAKASNLKWFPYNKGGEYRKWYGNQEYIVNWLNDGNEMQTKMHPDGNRIWAHNFNLDYNFKKHLTWNDLTSGSLSFRAFGDGFLFDSSAAVAFVPEEHYLFTLAYLNTKFVNELSKLLNPTMHFKLGDFCKLPYLEKEKDIVINLAIENVTISANDWDSYETSWDFKRNPLV